MSMNVREAQGRYPFTFWIEKANVSTVANKMVIEGVASTSNVDHDGERMSPEALKAMVDVVSDGGVPLRIEHSQKDNAIVGHVFEGWLDDRGAFHIKAELDQEHPAAPLLYGAITRGENYGLSVGGFVKRAVEELVEGVGREVKTFYDIILDEVSVTKHPSNYDAVGLKAVKSQKPTSDYLEAFAKSIPADDWKRVENYQFKSKDMSEKEKKEKAEKEESDTTKSVSRAEFLDLTKMVAEGFNGITAAMAKMVKGMSVEAKDGRMPDEKKDDPEAGKKAAVEKASAEAEDSTDEKKKDPEAGKESEVTKDRSKEQKEPGENNGSDQNGTREKSEKKDEDTYDLTTVQRAIKRIQEVSKAMDESSETETKKTADDTTEEKTKAAKDESSETTKAEKKEDSETVTKSRVAEIDQFALEVAGAIERMEKSLKEQGFQEGHIAKAVMDKIRSSPEMQSQIKEMARQPGAKRSVVYGTPFVKMRDGRMFKLTIEDHPQSKVEKSADGKKLSFKDMWSNSFSSTTGEE